MSSSSDKTSMMSSSEYVHSINFSYEEAASATNNFADENLITQGKTGVKLYKGQLSQSGQLINIVARLYPLHSYAPINELFISYLSNHKNMAPVFKWSFSPDQRGILISKYEANGSLNRYLSGSQTLTWMQRLHICVGVAHGLSYLHNHISLGSKSFIHGNIKSSKILLDDNWEPKLFGFQYSTEAKRGDTHRPSEYCDISAYTDPAYIDTKTLSHKSDVFSFGVVLFEVLFGREASSAQPNEGDNWHFVRLARQHHEEKTLNDMIDPDLRKQMDLQSLDLFSEIAYFCLKEVRSQRPDIDQVVRKLEKALEVQQRYDQSQEYSTPAPVERRISSHLKGKNVDHLKIRLSDIKMATQNFSERCEIGSGGYGNVYKADLYHFDGTNSYAIEAKNEGEFPKVLSTVAVKRIFRREDLQGEQGFIAEIELLSKCKHPNVVSLLGYCDEGPEMILIYEYASNGSLESYLGNPDNLTNLTWAQRIQICIDIAHGLSYLHTSTEEKEMIIHRDIKSANVLLDSNWAAKIADFGLSKLQHENQQGSTLVTKHVAGTDLYLDPEYNKTGKLKKASDIYSFGVVLFEMLCGKLAWDPIYYVNNQRGLPSIVTGQPFNTGTLKKMADHKIMETDENILKITGGVSQVSLDTFITIAYQCLAETQAQRPTIEAVIKELEKSLDFQKNSKDNFQMSFNELRLATNNFSENNCVGAGRFWKLYEGEAPGENGCNTIMVKRWDSKSDPKHHQEFLTEVEVLFKYKHECIIGLAGYCNEMDEKIIVYEHGHNGRLDKHLEDASLTWMKRLEICIDIASGLEFLHSGGLEQENKIKHRDIKSANILLNNKFRAKISNLELCIKTWVYEVVKHSYDSLGYVDPQPDDGCLTKESDIYSLGVVLMDMLYGRLPGPEGYENPGMVGKFTIFGNILKKRFDEMIFKGIKEQIVPQSLITFQMIILQCLSVTPNTRPSANQVVVQLKEALELQEDIEIWDLKLPGDYKEIIKMSITPNIYSTKTRKELYQIFHKGILLLGGKLWFSLSNNEERNEIISARMFSYKNHKLHKWRSVQKSRFQRVVKMLNVSNLNIQIKIQPQFLSQNVIYGAFLVFKFDHPRNISNQPMYVNLKYKIGGKTLNAYFATWRKDEWMMIELTRFLHDEKYTDFEVQLESFSRCYCVSGAICIEGIEFRAINDASFKVKPEVHEKLDGVITKLEDGEKSFAQSEAKLKKSHMLPAKMVLFNSADVKCFVWKSLRESRFTEVAELLSNQVFRIKCQIETQALSSNTNYACYLIFTLAEKCQGLQGPVRIHDVLLMKNKETKFLYFRTPSSVNLHDITRVPQQKEDGLKEVIVWEFNSNKINGDHISMHLKLICYEGTMRGLIVYGIEFRPI